MYRIYADDTLIYDSTLEDFRIGKGQITKEADKSGSFVFSVYPDHPFYNSFIQLRTVITVYKSGRIVFRGRILDDAVDYWNTKTLTCEGELGFLQDSVARPFSFQGDHADLFAQFIAEHNSQVDDWKKFKVGTVTVVDENEYINRSAGGYGAMLDTMQSALPDSALGGHFYITHGDDGTDPIPTLHYVADFPKTASQGIEFGVNLKDYTKKVSSTDLATCIIPLGTSNGSDGERLTIEDANDGKDYIYDAAAVALYGWIVKTVVFEDVTLANHLLTKAKAWLQVVVNQNATIELTALDMHLLDRSMESYNVCEYVRATSKPHGLDALMLCSKQTMDLLKPENDTVTLGYSFGTLTGANVKLGASVSTMGKKVSSIAQDAESIRMEVLDMEQGLDARFEMEAEAIRSQVSQDVDDQLGGYNSTIEQTATQIRQEIANEVEGLNSTITQTAESLSLEIQGVDDKYTEIKATVDGLTITDESGTTLIKGSSVDTSTLRVENVKVDLTGSVRWVDLTADVQNEINDAYALAADADAAAADALDAADAAAADAADAVDTVSGWRYGSTTYIDGTMLKTGTVMASSLIGGEVTLLTSAEREAGGLDITGASTSTYAIELWSYGALRLEAYSGAAYLGAGDAYVHVQEGGTTINNGTVGIDLDTHIWMGGSVFPVRDEMYMCGNSNFTWSDVWAVNVTQTSDRNKKKDISYDLSGYDPFFDGLKPSIYRFVNGTSGRKHPGFVAQDIKDLLTVCGIPTADFAGYVEDVDKDGNPTYGLRYSEFIPLIVEQVQKLKARVAKMEARA